MEYKITGTYMYFYLYFLIKKLSFGIIKENVFSTVFINTYHRMSETLSYDRVV